MLSVMKVSNVRQAASYYNSPDKYYAKDGGDIGSGWTGKGAEEIGLSGAVKGDDFTRLLEGRISDKVHLGKITKDGEINHVPGWDFTFSAPKSVSVLALVGEDQRLVNAHLEASKKAMAYIEQNYAMTRITEGGETRYQKVDNLIVAAFTHTESRKNDPQLHTHNVVMNAVKDNEGQWRSLETLRMFEGKLMSGLIYRYELANLVKELGYEIEVTDREKGFFDIRGVPDSLMKVFSKRRQQVLDSAQQRGLFDQKSMEKATLYSRDAKHTPEREALLESWKEAVTESGVDLPGMIERSVEQTQLQRTKLNSPKAKDNAGHAQLSSEAENTLPAQEPENERPVGPVQNSGAGLNTQSRSPKGRGEQGVLHREETIKGSDLTDETFTVESEQDLASHLLSSLSESLVRDVRLAYQVLAESEAVFNAEDLKKEVLKLSIFNDAIISPTDIDLAMNAMIESGELLPRQSRSNPGELAFTTPHAFNIERKMISLMLNGKGARPSIGTEAGIQEFISRFEQEKSAEFGSAFQFTEDQRQSIVEMATNKDLVSGVQGFAGTGKTTLLQCLIGYAEQQGYTVKGFGPTGSSKETLANETGIKAQTVDSFLFQRKKGEVSTGEIWLVDEASMVNGTNTFKMLAEADRSNAKLVLLGDTKQLESVEWGKAFAVLQDFKMATSSVTSIIRQKNETLLSAVHDSINRRFSNVFNKLHNTTYQIGKRDIGTDYLALTPEERAKTLVVIPDNLGRQQFNRLIHNSRIENGEISADEHKLSVLVNANLNAAQRRDARYYKVGQVIEFQRQHEEFKQGEFWNVIAIDKNTRLMEIRNEAGEIRAFDPASMPVDSKFSLDVYEKGEISVSKGETLRVTKSRNSLKVRNGDELTVASSDPANKTLTLTDGAGKDITVSTDGWHNLDYNYAQTAFGAQGKTVDRVMAVVESWRRNLINFRSVYVTLSRARHEAHLYVDDPTKVIENLSKHVADKSTSLTGMSQGDIRRYDEYNSDFRNLFADLEFTTQKLSLRQGVFSHTDLLKETLKHSIGTYGVYDVEKGISLMRARGDIGLSRISGEGRKTEHFYTLPTNIRTEAQVVRHMLQGRDRLPAIAGKSVVESYVKARNERAATGECEMISPEAGKALEQLLSSRDETVLVLGTDHSGHRELMRGAGRLLAESNGYKMRAFSTNTEGVAQLRESGSKAQNIFAHISRIEESIAADQKLNTRREVWVVENASQLGAEDTLRLQQASRYVGARVMLIADRQENSLSWGNVPTLLKQNGIATVNLDQSVRARNQAINLATDAVAEGKIDNALQHIGGMIESINAEDNHAEGRNARIEALSNTYLNLQSKDRDKTAVVVPDYFTRNKVDMKIRQGLQAEGSLKKDQLKTTLYRNASMDLLEKRKAQYYRAGQVIEFESERNGAAKGSYFTIRDANPQTNILTLVSHTTGETLKLNASDIAGSRGNSVRVYHVEEKALATGEQIRFNKSATKDRLIDADKNVPTKLSGTIKAIEGNTLTLEMQNGRSVKLDTSTFKHLEYAYTHNMYDLKDKRFENVVTLMESDKKHFATQAALHNVLTKSTLNLRIITDDKDKLTESLRHNTGFQQAALDSKKVTIDKRELDSFDKMFGLGLTPVNRGMSRLENAFSQAVRMAKDKVIEKAEQVRQVTQNYQRQKERSL